MRRITHHLFTPALFRPRRQLRGRIRILGDIVSPIDVEWEAETDPDRVLDP